MDGRTDVVCWKPSSPVLSVLLGDGAGRFTPAASLPILGTFGYLAIGDMNRDGRQDVVVSSWSHEEGRGTTQIIINRHNQSWVPGGAVPLDAWATSIALADVNGDARLDILTGHRDALLVSLGNGSGGYTGTTSYPLPDFGSGIGVGDFNEDGWPDVAVAVWQTVLVFLAKGGGLLSATGTAVDLNPHEPDDIVYRLALGDMNLDGHLDIVGNNLFAYAPGTGHGTFGASQTFSPYFSDFVLVDFNGDGLLDVMNDEHVARNVRDDVNDPPVLTPLEDLTLPYRVQFGEEDYELWAAASDPDLHRIRFEWRTDAGGVFSTEE